MVFDRTFALETLTACLGIAGGYAWLILAYGISGHYLQF